MELTVLGAACIPIGAVLFFLDKRYLFWAMVISAPFFDTSILLLSGLTTMVRPSYYFGGLFVLRCVLDYAVSRESFRPTRESLLAILFLLVSLISASMPFFMEGEIFVIPTDSSVNSTYEIEYEALAFTRSSLTQLLYPLFLILCFVVTTDYLRRVSLQRQVMRVLVRCGLGIIVSGFIYIFLVVTGRENFLEWLYWLTNGERELRIYMERGLGGLPLVYSLAGEPGYTGMYLLLMLGPILGALYYRDKDLLGSQKLNLAFLALVVITLVLCAGTTGYVGLVVLCAVSLVVILLGESRANIVARAYFRLGILVIAAAVIITVGYNWFFESSFTDYLSTVHISKIQGVSGSGVVRKEVTLHNLGTFMHSPLFGVGYGNDRGLAMSAFLLANVGIVGTVVFYLLILSVVGRGWRNLRHPALPPGDKPLLFGMMVALITMFTLMQFAKSESALLFVYFWIVLAGIAAYAVPQSAPAETGSADKTRDST